MSGDTTATASIDVDLDVAEIDMKIPEDELKVSNLDIWMLEPLYLLVSLSLIRCQ